MPENYKSRTKRIRDDHYLHWFVLLSVALWAGTVFDWYVGVATLIALIIVISLTNSLIMAVGGDLRCTKLSRWGWLVVAAIMIGLTATEPSWVS